MFLLKRKHTIRIVWRAEKIRHPNQCPAQECAHPEIHAVLVERALEAQMPGFGFGGKTQEPDGGC